MIGSIAQKTISIGFLFLYFVASDIIKSDATSREKFFIAIIENNESFEK